jgi:hypothetical protein
MADASTMAKYFCGAVAISKSAQVAHLEVVPGGYYVDDEFHQTTIHRNLYTTKTIESRFVFEGVPATIADDLSGSVAVTDISGKSYTVSFDENIVDGSSGTAVLEKESNHVNITKMSPHLRTVEVVNRISTHFCNDVQII